MGETATKTAVQTAEIGIGKRVLIDADHDLAGVVVSTAHDGAEDVALVALDSKDKSRWVPVRRLTRKVGRPPGPQKHPKDPKPTVITRVLTEVLEAEMGKSDMTWDVLSERSGVSRSTIARVLASNGDGQRIETLEALAVALGISPRRFWEAR